MSTLSSANVKDVNLVLKERAHKIKMKYSMHQYSNSYAYFRQLPNAACYKIQNVKHSLGEKAFHLPVI